MEIFMIIFILIAWSVLGLAIMVNLVASDTGFAVVNPVYNYKNFKVNIFGALAMAILFSLICPIGTIGYWFYKLCTFGRSDFE